MGNRAYVDTNIILDYLQERPNGVYVEGIFLLAHSKKIELITSVLNFSVIFYVQRKRGYSQREIYTSFNYINKIITAVDQTSISYKLALQSDFKDFEDALQHFSAIEAKADCLITENKKDFRKSNIPVFTAREYIRKK